MIWVLMLLALTGDGDPELHFEERGGPVLRMPLQVIEDPGLREHLLSGLTTTFQFGWSVRERAKPVGGIRLEIRFEPWDEIFFLNYLSSDGTQKSLQFPNQEALATWWSTHPFELFGVTQEEARKSLWLSLRVIPFSQQEQEMAREWLTPQNNKPDSGLFSGRTGNRRSTDRQRQNNLLRIMFATSIQREVIKSYRWRINVP